MKLRVHITVAFCAACAGFVLAADSDETAYSSRAYAPRSSAGRAKPYQAPGYAPSRPPRTVGKPLATSSPSRWWNPFHRNKTLEVAPSAKTPLQVEATPYLQQKHTSVPTFKPDPRAIQERKPFIASERNVSNGGFTPAEKSEWKNPLLKPRQGIKDTAE